LRLYGKSSSYSEGLLAIAKYAVPVDMLWKQSCRRHHNKPASRGALETPGRLLEKMFLVFLDFFGGQGAFCC
jgi:hypothetical protein